MRKSNDTTKTRELTEAELAAVSGGAYTLENTMVSSYYAAGGGTVGDGSGSGSARLRGLGPYKKQSLLMVKIMSLNLGGEATFTELRDDELENVSGRHRRDLEHAHYCVRCVRRSALTSARAKIWW